MIKTCLNKDCKKEYKTSHRISKFCSQKCFKLHEVGENANNWQGGRVVSYHGYILINKPKHPNANMGYVPEHRLVIEKKIGRYLTKLDIVHHKNGNRQDNRLRNLKLTTRSKHNKIDEGIKRGQFKKKLIISS